MMQFDPQAARGVRKFGFLGPPPIRNALPRRQRLAQGAIAGLNEKLTGGVVIGRINQKVDVARIAQRRIAIELRRQRNPLQRHRPQARLSKKARQPRQLSRLGQAAARRLCCLPAQLGDDVRRQMRRSRSLQVAQQQCRDPVPPRPCEDLLPTHSRRESMARRREVSRALRPAQRETEEAEFRGGGQSVGPRRRNSRKGPGALRGRELRLGFGLNHPAMRRPMPRRRPSWRGRWA